MLTGALLCRPSKPDITTLACRPPALSRYPLIPRRPISFGPFACHCLLFYLSYTLGPLQLQDAFLNFMKFSTRSALLLLRAIFDYE